MKKTLKKRAADAGGAGRERVRLKNYKKLKRFKLKKLKKCRRYVPSPSGILLKNSSENYLKN